MTGLSVLYAKEAAGEREWAAIPGPGQDRSAAGSVLGSPGGIENWP